MFQYWYIIYFSILLLPKLNNILVVCVQDCVNSFYQLDEKINSVAVKVMHLGGQLEAVNIPRSRADEAQKLMLYLSQFLIPGNGQIEVFSDPDKVSLSIDCCNKCS